MKVLVLLALATAAGVPAARAAQKPAQAAQAPDPVAEAYAQFLLANRLEDDDNAEGAIAAYRRAIALDPKAGEVVAALADLYLRQERLTEALNTAEQALKVSPDSRAAHRVIGTIYASIATSPQQRGGRAAQRENLGKAIDHLERALVQPVGLPDANLRAMLARLYIGNGDYDKAIPILADLVKQEPGWQDGPTLLLEAYSMAGRGADAIKWLEEAVQDAPQLYATLADFYGRDRRWADAGKAYERALEHDPRAFDLRVRYGSMLLGAGSREQVLRARDVLREAIGIRGGDERALYLLSQAERQAGDLDAAEKAARRLIAQNADNPRGFAALAEALEERRRYREVVDELAPVMAGFRSSTEASAALSLLLPHLGFAYQQVGEHQKAIEAFEEARRVSPRDPAVLAYLIQAHVVAKRFTTAVELARAARVERPDDLRIVRLEAEALRQSGRPDEGVQLLEDLLGRRPDNAEAYIALARIYADTDRAPQAARVLEDARAKFPDDTDVSFEIGAQFERQKKFAEAEAAFRRVLAVDPGHAAALNYLGYMLAERGERLSESIDLIKRALEVEPENGSYLDSLGWAYYKDGKLDLAEDFLRRAAQQLTTNSVVQDHYGDVLLRLGRVDEAIGAWNRALTGDGDSIDRDDIDRKIRAARQKLPRGR
jgi:tetratricopeptide (TPR) repeat protein